MGDKIVIETRLQELNKLNTSIWLEIVYNGKEIFPLLSSWVNDLIKDSKLEVLKLINREQLKEVLTTTDTSLSLDELNEFEVFIKCLEKNKTSNDQKILLTDLYKEIVNEYYSKD